MVAQNGHINHYAAETVIIKTRNDSSTQQNKENMHAMNIFLGLTVIVPLVAILGTSGGNVMLTILIVLALIPAGYIFATFF